jgi:hypothetical protein
VCFKTYRPVKKLIENIGIKDKITFSTLEISYILLEDMGAKESFSPREFVSESNLIMH